MGTKIVFTPETMQIMALFDKITHASLKDCIIEESSALFIVDKGELRKAIGKGAQNVKTLERKLGKRVKIVEYADQVCQFVANLMYPAKVKNCEERDGVVTLEAEDYSSRGVMIGRGGANLRRVEQIAGRYFPVQEVKVKQ